MTEPVLTFIYNKSGVDTPYVGAGAEDDNFGVINSLTDTLVFTGGGISDDVLTSPTCASGTRSATIRPNSTSFVIPYTYVESTIMNRCMLVGHNVNRYTMGVYVDGYMSSDLYLEAWDDNSFSSTDLPILQGSTNSLNESYMNAIRTTSSEPPWHPGWSGADIGAAYLRGTFDRVGLKNASFITNETVYYNIYVRLQVDSQTFHNTPILGFRYTYI